MPTGFDPYYKWLGIPREEQPPNLYRLLGLRAFESDPDVISNAADQRMALLKTFAIGNHRELSESLLNEVARARVCLLNLANKLSYDTKLREMIAQPTSCVSPLPRMETVTAHSSQAVGETKSKFESVNADWIPSVGIKRRDRKTSSGSRISSLVGAIIAGIIGLSAGYLVLCVIDVRYDFLHLINVNKPSKPQKIASSESPRVPELPPIAQGGRELPQNVPRPKPPIKKQPELPPARILPPAQPALPPAQPVQPAQPPAQPAQQPAHPALPPASALVVLEFDKPVIRIIATPVGIELRDVLCDIAINPQLMRNAMMGNPEALQVVFSGLKIRDKKTHEIPLQIKNAGAALEVSIAQRSNSIVCEIRPQFSLPVNGIEELTKDRGTELHNKLTAQLGKIETFRRVKPAFRDEMAQRRSDMSNAQSALNSGNLNPAGANSARAAVTRAQRAIEILQKRIDNGEALQRDESAIKTELDALNQIESYAKNVKGIAQVYVRFYNDDVTVPAVVK